ncbi:MAG: hypothetical protein HY080_16670 [Gammaproteobacteria bacterium]|nr:hypothetical protein [Gammaproteobacteria bacterium]
MSEEIIQHWLHEVSRTVAANDLTGHLNLISRRVALSGVPGFETIGYDDWARQCTHEFNQRLIRSVQYRGLKLRAATPERIMFKTYETVTATDGGQNSQGIEVLIEKEPDGVWRVVQERILPEAESRHDGFIPGA